MNRSQIIERGDKTIVLDAYNANPTSMKAAIDNLKQMQATHKGVILGDMLELGEEEEQEHYKVGLQLVGLDFDLVIFCGERMKAAYKACPDALYFADREAVSTYMQQQPPKEMHLLLKGSRGMGLEKLLEVL